MENSHFLSPQKIVIKRRDGALILKMDGQCLQMAPPRRAVPLSAPDEFIVLSSEAGEELGVIRRIADLEPDSRELLEDELYQRYKTIVIERVLSVKRDPISGLIRWAVEIESDESDEPQLAAGLKPSLGVRLLKRARTKTTVHTEGTANGAVNGAANNGVSSDADGDAAGNPLPGEEVTGSEVVFYIAGTEDVQNARYPRIFIGDTQGRKYEIPNCEALDLTSRRLGERYF